MEGLWVTPYELQISCPFEDLGKADLKVTESWVTLTYAGESAIFRVRAALSTAASQASRYFSKSRQKLRIIWPPGSLLQSFDGTAQSCASPLDELASALESYSASVVSSYQEIPSPLETSTSSSSPSPSRPKKDFKRARIWRTCRHTGEKFNLAETMMLGERSGQLAKDNGIFVNPTSISPKEFLGFGGSFTESSALVFHKMSKEKQEEILRMHFHPWDGLGYAMGRIPIGSCDFGLGNWTCGDLKDGDSELTGFSIERYKESILPFYRRAQKMKSGEPLKLLASPWSPPPWMKTSGQFHGDGHLRPECRAAWALHFAKFVKEMEKAGVPIWGVSVQNECEASQKWESCVYTAEEMRDFVRDHLGPTLEKEGLGDTKILIWDHNRDGMVEHASVVYADPAAAKWIWGVAFHWYGDGRYEHWPGSVPVMFEHVKDKPGYHEVRSEVCFDNVRMVADLRPEKHLLFTEACQELGKDGISKYNFSWKTADRYAANIIKDLGAGTEGWIDWNLILDETGGPNHVGNNCMASVICQTEKDSLDVQPFHHYLKHFSRGIYPGSRRVMAAASHDILELLAFLRPDGSLVIIILNQGLIGPFHMPVRLPDRAFQFYLLPESTIVLDEGWE